MKIVSQIRLVITISVDTKSTQIFCVVILCVTLKIWSNLMKKSIAKQLRLILHEDKFINISKLKQKLFSENYK